jgi:branched-chain amino acid transport system substrate-binding protein
MPSLSASPRTLCAALLALGSTFAHAAEPVRIGLVLAKQGTWAEVGTYAATAAEIAVQQAGGKVLDRPVELTWLDEANPQSAQQNIGKLIADTKVVGVIGGTNSATGLAMAAVAKREKVPLIVSNAAAREITGAQCNRYTFRTILPTPAAARALTPTLLEKGKDWYFLVGNYAYGLDIHNSFAALLKQAGGSEKGFDPVPIGTTDFSSYILKIKGAKPQVVVVGLGGSDQINFLKQWVEFGLKDTALLTTPITSDSAFWAIGDKAATGVYGMQWHYTDPNNSPAEKDFVKRFTEKVGKPPVIEAWLGWTSMRMMLAGIAKAGSTSSKDVVTAMENLTLEENGSKTYYRSWDHQLIHQVLVTRAQPAAANDKWNMIKILDRVPAQASQLDGYYGSREDVGCKLDPL